MSDMQVSAQLEQSNQVSMGNAHIKEDYYIGGCPPHHNHVGAAITALLSLFIRLDRNESSHTYTEADVR